MSAPGDLHRIGRYEVLERIGRGAMGTVYRAHDPQIGRTIAIKVLLVDEDDLRARFRQEVRTAGTLTHQNIAAIYDYGEADGRPFIVMEYVEGRTLAELLRDRVPLTLAYKLRLIQQLCAALDYAHARGVVHRDIKPANLMLDRHGDLKIVDFGVAKMGDGQLTRTGDVLGTLTYMSPEQIDGGVIDRRSDIFSVGVVLYEVVSSHRAFRGDSPSHVIRAILNEQPVALAELCPELDPALDKIVRTAIQKDPAHRYQSLGQLAADLAKIPPAAGIDVKADDPTGTLRIDRRDSAHRLDVVPPPAKGDLQPQGRSSSGMRSAWIGLASAFFLVAIGAGIWLAVTTMRKSTSTAVVAEPQPGRVPIPPVTTPASVPPVATTTSPAPSGKPGAGVAQPPRAEVRPLPDRQPQPVAVPTSTPPLTPYEEAKALLSGNATPADQSKAAGLLRTACDNGETPACMQAGLMYRDNTAVRNLPIAAQMFQRACDAGTPQGCNFLGQEYMRGVAIGKDEAKAASLYKRACDAGGPQGCSNLARAYQQGRGVTRDDAEARSLYQRACEGGASAGCLELGILLTRGVGGPADEPRAVALFQRACDDGNPVGCGNLALAYTRGTAVPRDDVRAASLYQRACDAGGAPACANLSTMYTIGRGVTKDLARAVVLLERSCEGNFADGCQTLSQRYEHGVGVEPNRARAAELLRRANQLRGVQTPDAATVTRGTTAPVGGVAGGVPGGSPAVPPPAAAPPPPAAAPPGPVRVGGTIKAPTKTKHVNAVYPQIARSTRVQGVVFVETVIGPNGKVSGAKVVRSIPLLDQAALEAVRQWEFTPTIVNGVAVPLVTTVTVTFSLQ